MRRFLGAVVIVCCLNAQASAQFVDDALRYSTTGLGVGARALGMGGAYTGVANDYSALFWNPAGLAQMEYGEFSFGLSHTNYLDGSNFLTTNSSSLASNATKLNALGIVYPVPVRRGSLVLAFGYQRQADFTTGVSFSGFNPNSSIIQTPDPQTWAPNGATYPSDLTNNLAYQLYLANIDTVNGTFISPINGRLTQIGKVLEEGGLSNWSAGGALDVSKNLSVGITLTYVSGTYHYTSDYKEQDNNGVYQTPPHPFDFDQLTVQDDVQSDISGVNAKFGLMYRDPDHFRLGLTIKTPTSFRVKEDFSTTAQSFFDNGQGYGPIDLPGSDEFDLVTPWVFGAGASVILNDLVLSGEVEYTDWTSMEFQNANPSVIALNTDIKDILRGTANLRAGAEYTFGTIGLRLRGGFMYNTSPYQGDPSTFNQKYATAGLGFPLGESAMLDLGYAHGWWDTFRVNYAGGPRLDESVATNNLIASLSFRF